MLRPFDFASDSRCDLPHSVLVVFTSKIFVVRPFRVVHEAKASHYTLRHPCHGELRPYLFSRELRDTTKQSLGGSSAAVAMAYYAEAV